MKIVSAIIFGCLSFLPLRADSYRDFDFSQERMILVEDGIYLNSTFDSCDKITAYSHYGDFLWETEFFAKIISWEVMGTRVIVFSKHRSGSQTYLTCLDRYSGEKIWQRPH